MRARALTHRRTRGGLTNLRERLLDPRAVLELPTQRPLVALCRARAVATQTERIAVERVGLRELRVHVPHHAWWDSGAAAALLEYQARTD